MKPQTINSIVASKLCFSCGVCDAICSNNAISFHETIGGNLFPKISAELCTGCGLCFKVCPGNGLGPALSKRLPEDIFKGTISFCAVGKATNEKVFKNSQSGGAATAVLNYLFDTKQIEYAIVATMGQNSPPRGEPILINSAEQLFEAQKSKYTPIPILRKLKGLKNSDKAIAIVGLPCHMHGLLKLIDLVSNLKKRRIIKLGLICERIMTTTAIDYLCSKSNLKQPNGVIFKDKKYGYPGDIVVSNNSSETLVIDRSFRKHMKDFFTPARCRICFDKFNIFADIVFGDPHGIDETDKNNGESLIIVRSSVGEDILKKVIKHNFVKMRNIKAEDALNGQKIEKKRSEWHMFMSAWENKRLQLPDYNFTRTTNNKRQEKLIDMSLKLDQYQSANELFSATDRWALLQKILAKKPIKKIYRLFTKLNWV